MRASSWSTALGSVLTASLLATAVLSPLTAAAESPWVLGYWVGYQADLMPVDQIPWSSLTHIAVGPVVPRSSGKLDVSMGITPETATTLAREIATTARAHGVTSILMIGGGGAEKAFLKAGSKRLGKFVKSLRTLRSDLGFDGFDLDYEGNFDKPAQQRMFRKVVGALRRTDPQAVLTFPAITVTTTFPQDGAVAFYAAIAPQLDHLFLQTYGMSGPYPGWLSWHSSPLFGEDDAAACGALPACTPTSVEFNVERFLAAGIPPEKLGLGVGFYGTCWQGVSGPRQDIAGSQVPASDNEMSYVNIVSSYRPLMTEGYDAVAGAAYLSADAPQGPEGCTFVSYETAESIAAKGAYARAKGLSGTIVWTINQAHGASDAQQPDALLDATAAAFR